MREPEKKRRKAVEGHAAKPRLDRMAPGGSIRSEFNAAINANPARPTIREPGSVPAVHSFGGNDGPQMTPSPNNRGWVDGEPGKERARGGRAGHWIAGAIKHPGALHRRLGVPEGEKIPAKKLTEAAHSKSPEERKEASLARVLKGFHR